MSQSSVKPVASLESLPTEIADTIYYSLTPSTLARLARVSKDIYAAVQSPLYRKPVLNSFRKLQLFARTLKGAETWDFRSGDAESKTVVHLTLLIEPAVEEARTGKPLIAVLLARLLRFIERYNPHITISIIISHSACDSQPVRSFESEVFPRVTTLILDLGEDPTLQSDSHSSGSGSRAHGSIVPIRPMRRPYSRPTPGHRCVPNAKFWTRFFNGSSFPHLQRLELHHRSWRGTSTPAYYNPAEPILFTTEDTLGLAKIERLVVNCVPEFNDSVLMAGLQHAPRLTDLHIEDCRVTYIALDKLLTHALPILHRLVLRIPRESPFARTAREGMNIRNSVEENPHLCPHFRKNGRNLKHIEFAAPFICRDLFLDGYEFKKLVDSGHPGSLQGDVNGNIVSGNLDIVLITGVVRHLRQNRETDSGTQKAACSESFEEDKQALEKERSLRTRRATIQKQKWTRKYNVLEGMCIDGDTYPELVALAEVEEDGIAWTLGHAPGNTVSTVLDGMTREARYEDEFPEDQRRRAAPSRRVREHDMNDSLSAV
ncbi:hypothetical protein DRE_03979 [Drechslerella stenobrocha 248]|uniref:F-box domain-containing protein n=1 Tax=Drechslerella stenobrocha 248 TaxID=1043628 RepID=W7HTK6_9PEZI|nr:hypothetical protein DRE_03979 [Drechslerella stenobrocha 248]